MLSLKRAEDTTVPSLPPEFIITPTPLATLVPKNACDECAVLGADCTNTDLVSLSSDTRIADIDVVTKRSDVRAIVIAQCDIKMIRGSTFWPCPPTLIS